MRTWFALLSTAALAVAVPQAMAAPSGAEQPAAPGVRSNPVSPPRAAQPEPLVAPQIKMPQVKPRPLTVDPPALQGGKPAPLGGYDDAARRCESMADIEQRTQCRDKVARETPMRPAR